MTTALVRRPSPALGPLATRQWRALVEALGDAGCRVVEVEPLDDSALGVAVGDVAVAVEDLVVATRPADPCRHTEGASLLESARSLGLDVAAVDAPAVVEGRDVMVVGRTAYVGLGGYTTGAGIAALARLLRAKGARVQAVPATRSPGLLAACAALPDGTVAGWPPVVDDRDAFPVFAELPEERGTDVLAVGPEHVLVTASAPLTAQMLRGRGLAVDTVDVSALEEHGIRLPALAVRIEAGT